MPLERLDNLVKARKLKTEAPDQNEFNGLVSFARNHILDSKTAGLSEDSQFSLAYSGAHSLALAAMRWHGYRSENRYLVFQCLPDTIGLENVKWRILDKCHKQRNLAEYEGHLEITPQLLLELIAITEELLILVESLDPVHKQ